MPRSSRSEIARKWHPLVKAIFLEIALAVNVRWNVTLADICFIDEAPFSRAFVRPSSLL